MTSSKRPATRLRCLVLATICLAISARADDDPLRVGGHTKLNGTAIYYPPNSVFRELLGANEVDLQAELRLNVEWRQDRWSADAHYQLIAIRSESIAALTGAGIAGGLDFLGPAIPTDDRRLMNLTDVIHQSGDSSVVQRLDRFWFGYSSEKLVVRAGRQALSWGNGLFYAPMDLINPFDPATVDTEYKSGDDMLYGQYLRDSGDDLQAATVIRRDPSNGNVAPDEASSALKYHGFAAAFEYDLLLAENYGDPVLGVGISRGIGGAVAGADLVLTQSDNSTYAELVANLGYSWVFAGRNMTGSVEYYFNEFGSRGDVDIADLAQHPELYERLLRGQQFTLGRNYIAGSVSIEMSPLWTLTPVLLANIDDPSALLQVTSSYSLSNNTTLLANFNLPLGADGSEFAGIAALQPDRYLATGGAFFLQFAGYF